jgi:hypothetical protein
MNKLIPIAALMAAVAALSGCEKRTTVVNPPSGAPVAVPVPAPVPGPAGAPGPAGSPGAPAPAPMAPAPDTAASGTK